MPIKKLVSWLLPYTCILCRRRSDRKQDLCTPCYHDLPSAQYRCRQCAHALLEEQPLCGACLAHPPPFETTFALFDYQHPIDTLLLELKFHQALIHARVLGEIMSEQLQLTWAKSNPIPDALLAVPLHPARLKARGYNQATEIARPIAHFFQRPLLWDSCQRIKATAPQAMLLAHERKNNIKNAFASRLSFAGQHLAVIDDVMTTGHTVHEFSRLLKNKGAKRVDIWCIARPKIST